MLSARTESALIGISNATRQKGVRVKHLYRIMTHYPDLWVRAYANIYSNKGSMTKGVDGKTLDGMSQDRIAGIIDTLKDGTYKPRPAKRVYIPKAKGKRRPLGIPAADDKLVQEVVRMLLEQVYEPIFSERSHGFRPKRSCHTALVQVKRKWKSIRWIVDMDISSFYDNIDHCKMVEILKKKIDDRKFIGLIVKLLKAGYLEDWKYHKTISGTPQGGICSPILSNIFLHELDEFVEKKMESFNRGIKRRGFKPYERLENKLKWARHELSCVQKRGGVMPWFEQELKDKIADLKKQMKKIPCRDPLDENYRKLQYVRYADDFAIGVDAPKSDAMAIAAAVKDFLREDLSLEIAEEKSGIHHVKKGFDFLGYHISYNQNNKILKKSRVGVNKEGKNVYGTLRSVRCQLGLQIPKEKVWEFCKRKGYLKKGMPIHRPELLNLSDYEIVSTYNAEMRGFVNYYNLAAKPRLYILHWAGLCSMWKTLAHKHKTSGKKMRRKMKVGDDHYVRYEVNGVKKSLKVFKIKHQSVPDIEKLDDIQPTYNYTARTEIVQRFNAQKCEYCGIRSSECEVHHINSVKNLKNKKNKSKWEVMICARSRNTMVLCKECHKQSHKGELPSWKRDFYTKTESAVQ